MSKETIAQYEEIIRKRKLLQIIPVSNTWLYDAIKRGDFPAPIKLGTRAVGWRRSEIIEWLAGRALGAGK